MYKSPALEAAATALAESIRQLGPFLAIMSSAEPYLYDWYYQDGYPAELGGWVYDNGFLTGVLASSTGNFAAPVGESTDVAVTGYLADSSLLFAQTLGGWQSDVRANGYFSQTPVGSIN